ncbi:MarR family transcriptional regulator [Candidatus Saccharibacteria bacterium]|nr:MarR family transcriptional regulator [Candidatus Saccharibacteria bacterium]
MERNNTTTSTYSLLIQLMMQSKHQLHAVAEALGLSAMQAQTLMMLGEDAMTMSAIGRSLACDASNVTGIVDRLDAAGMINRQLNQSDRRVKLVDLSDRGSETRGKIISGIVEAEIARIGPALTNEEVETLNGLLQKLIDRSAER